MVVSLFKNGKFLMRLCLQGLAGMLGVTQPPLTPAPILIIWRHFTVFIDHAAFCLTHREGLGSVYNSYFWESYFSTFICVCLEKSLQISSFWPKNHGNHSGSRNSLNAERGGGWWRDGGVEWRSLRSHSSSNIMVSNGLLMFSWGWLLSSWWAVKWNAINELRAWGEIFAKWHKQ